MQLFLKATGSLWNTWCPTCFMPKDYLLLWNHICLWIKNIWVGIAIKLHYNIADGMMVLQIVKYRISLMPLHVHVSGNTICLQMQLKSQTDVKSLLTRFISSTWCLTWQHLSWATFFYPESKSHSPPHIVSVCLLFVLLWFYDCSSH